MSVIEITSQEQFKEIINSGKTAFFDFWAEWCGPCKMISPVFKKLSEAPENKDAQFYKVDVDKQPEIAQEVGIRAMPTFIVFKSGAKHDELVGANPAGLQALVTKWK